MFQTNVTSNKVVNIEAGTRAFDVGLSDLSG